MLLIALTNPQTKNREKEMGYVTSKGVGNQVLEALGINTKNVTTFSIHFKSQDAVRVVVETLVNSESMTDVIEILGGLPREQDEQTPP
jgi:hypothetical protein